MTKHARTSTRTPRAAFSLIELMIAVAIIGVLASLAVPAFRTVLLRSRTGEVSGNLSALFKSAATYYSAERAEKGQTASMYTACTVADVVLLPSNPQAQKQRMPNTNAQFLALGFSVADYVYFGYGLATETGAATCGGTPNDSTVYTIFAHGDLDNDSTQSTFELAIGSDKDNQLFHARGMYIDKDTE
jgi:prepilin-type N-terminal cleavage/methylation domain-containing protein